MLRETRVYEAACFNVRTSAVIQEAMTVNELDDAFKNVRRHIEGFPIHKEGPARDAKINKEQLITSTKAVV